MKISTKRISYDKAISKEKPKHKRPRKPLFLLGILILILSIPDMIATKFSYTKTDMDKAGDGPYLILMNHSSFIDLKIAYKIFFPKKFNIVCTSDGFVGKPLLMRLLGCIPTQKFVTDATLVLDMMHTVRKNKMSILMYPEASYTFDGCATDLPKRLGALLKKLDIPVVMITTDGAFLRQPLYNGLRLRRTKVSANVKCILSRDEIKEKSVDELDSILKDAFSFDNFARQYESGTEITEKDRAEGLERILYKCAACGKEGSLSGHGTDLTCSACGKTYNMTTLGQLEATDGNTEYSHIPDWFKWQRECVRGEIEDGSYKLDAEVDIGLLVDYDAIYMVGSGRLIHDENGFVLTGCDGKLSYTQSPTSSYSLYADYFWYEIGDVISIGNKEILYYCFPKGGESVAKARLATEELYKIKSESIKARTTR